MKAHYSTDTIDTISADVIAVQVLAKPSNNGKADPGDFVFDKRIASLDQRDEHGTRIRFGHSCRRRGVSEPAGELGHPGVGRGTATGRHQGSREHEHGGAQDA